MTNIQAVRDRAIDQMKKSLVVVDYILKGLSPSDTNTYRDGGDGWTVNEVIGHLCDFEAVFLQRAEITIEQDNPPLPFPDPDALAAENKYNEQNVMAVYKAWTDNRHQFIEFLNAQDDTTWERVAQHPKRGPVTLSDQLLLVPWHDLNHMEQITKILAQR